VGESRGRRLDQGLAAHAVAGGAEQVRQLEEAATADR
jgi:hypothetical protein